MEWDKSIPMLMGLLDYLEEEEAINREHIKRCINFVLDKIDPDHSQRDAFKTFLKETEGIGEEIP